MLKRQDDDEHEEDESENWLASYSDLVTDLMAVFVLLLSFALVVQATKNASGDSVLDGGSGLLDEGQGMMSQYTEELDSRIDALIQELKDQVKNAGLDGEVSVNRDGKYRIIIRMEDSILFDSGQAEIKEEFKPTLTRIADILSEYENIIQYVRIEGHTDDRPINTGLFPSNWELSAYRAAGVVRYLIETSSIQGEKFSQGGYAEFRPLADNETTEGRALNRRVEFSIDLMDENTIVMENGGVVTLGDGQENQEAPQEKTE